MTATPVPADDSARYPVGKFTFDGDTSAAADARRIATIAGFPARLREVVSGMSDAQLENTYRDGGWTARQVVHHVADSHANAYIRFKLSLTEDRPTIKPYDEAAWARLGDVRTVPVTTSLALLDALHERWIATLRAASPSDLERGYTHPDQNRFVSLHEALALYAWHCEHHLGHVMRAKG